MSEDRNVRLQGWKIKRDFLVVVKHSREPVKKLFQCDAMLCVGDGCKLGSDHGILLVAEQLQRLKMRLAHALLKVRLELGPRHSLHVVTTFADLVAFRRSM